ncbi:MAG: LPS export ABC transporter periplasmic protein LptC [Campylobacter sp.]|nr:LPS export ABC transporter periplasmic protein LptC [Campylobacter sp.]
MAVKFFYGLIAFFIVTIAFLTVQTPYINEFFDENLSVANMQMGGIVDYDINSSVISVKTTATSGTRYKTHDEFYEVKADRIDDVNSTIIANKAIYKGDILTLLDDATYINSDDMVYVSDEIIYDSKANTLTSNTPYILSQDINLVKGSWIKYDISKKQTFSKGISAWYQLKE